MIRFNCSYCQSICQADEAKAGQLYHCHCGAWPKVPGVAAEGFRVPRRAMVAVGVFVLALGLTVLLVLGLRALGGRSGTRAVGADIGSVGVPGSDQCAGDVYTVSGSGEDIWLGRDSFHFVSRPASGDVTIIAKVVSQSGDHEWAKSGVMIRGSDRPDAAFAHVMVTPMHGVCLQWRSSVGALAEHFGDERKVSLPVWLKLQRDRGTVTAFLSEDGSTWSPVSEGKGISLEPTALVGLAVCSHDQSRTATAVFQDVVVR